MNTLTGNEWINCGVSGATSKTWQSNSNRLAKAQTEGVVQAYIIGLGINDSNSSIADYLPVGAISDIGTNNDTYYAQLSKVIVELATISPDAFIFVNTCPYREKERIAPYNVAIKNIVEHFKDTYKIHCIDLAGYYSDLFYSPDFVGMFYQVHPTVEGHATIAKMYEFALSDYMRQNEVSFRNIPWTPYGT
jgi:lysophospholipase L1-like esterase